MAVAVAELVGVAVSVAVGVTVAVGMGVKVGVDVNVGTVGAGVLVDFVAVITAVGESVLVTVWVANSSDVSADVSSADCVSSSLFSLSGKGSVGMGVAVATIVGMAVGVWLGVAVDVAVPVGLAVAVGVSVGAGVGVRSTSTRVNPACTRKSVFSAVVLKSPKYIKSTPVGRGTGVAVAGVPVALAPVALAVAALVGSPQMVALIGPVSVSGAVWAKASSRPLSTRRC